MLKTIRQGDKGNTVKIAQYMTQYCERKKASGEFDAAFFEHVKGWQEKNGLAADGIVGPATWRKLAEVAPACSTSENKKCAHVCAIQLILGGLTVDGDYGNNTKKAVSAFQSANGMSANGKVESKTWKKLVEGNSSSSEGSSGDGNDSVPSGGTVVNKKPIDYKQYDNRWGKVKYSTHTSSQTIANSGCGPTSMADIVATWWDKKITPKELCKLSVDNGYRTYDSGTAWGFFSFCAKKYKAAKYIQTTSIATLKASLQQGAYAVVSFRKSKWTSGGHFCCIWKWDGKQFYINDPASSSSARAKGTEKEVKDAAKQFFIFFKEDPSKATTTTTIETKSESKVETTDSKVETTKTKSGAIGTAIIDISKWQGTIDFDKVAKEVSFIIARASCGSDKDIKIDEYANAMNERNIPFGVYCYSYAGDVAKAKDEAQKIVKYASQYNPLFYVLDAEEERLTNAAIKAFANELRAQGAKKIGCYVAHHRYKSYDYDSARSLYDFTWIPRYGSNNGTQAGSTIPAYACDLWQYTSCGTISGISGNVDMNVITGIGHDLNWFLGQDNAVIEEAEKTRSKVRVVNGNVNVRTLPNTGGEIIGVAYDGDELEYLGETTENGWLSVVYDGQNGWISGKYGQLV